MVKKERWWYARVFASSPISINKYVYLFAHSIHQLHHCSRHTLRTRFEHDSFFPFHEHLNSYIGIVHSTLYAVPICAHVFSTQGISIFLVIRSELHVLGRLKRAEWLCTGVCVCVLFFFFVIALQDRSQQKWRKEWRIIMCAAFWCWFHEMWQLCELWDEPAAAGGRLLNEDIT